MVKDNSADWDRPLTTAEIESLAPATAAQRNRLSLTRKIAVLQSFLERPSDLAALNEAEQIPWKRPALRIWQDETQKIWKWKNSKVDSPDGKNADLIARYQKTLSSIKRVLDGEQDAKDAQIKVMTDRISELEKQNLNLLDQIVRLQAKTKRG